MDRIGTFIPYDGSDDDEPVATLPNGVKIFAAGPEDARFDDDSYDVDGEV